MNRSRSQIDGYSFRYPNLHKPGVVPRSSRRVSPITSNFHKYELKQPIHSKKSVESWFEHHSPEDRRAVFSFLNTLYQQGENFEHNDPILTNKQKERRTRSPTSRGATRLGSGFVQNSSSPTPARAPSNQSGRVSRASRKDLGEILESLESLRPSTNQEKGIQITATPIITKISDVNRSTADPNSEKSLKRATSSKDKYSEIVPPTEVSNSTVVSTNDDNDTKISRRYLSHTWRVINPLEDPIPNVRPENNSSSFFNYTKKVQPEYFFIHPDWY